MKQPLPSSWLRTEIGAIFETVTGSTPPKDDPDNYGSAIPLVKPPELRGEPIYGAPDGLSETGASKARVLPVGSVLVSCIGNLGKVGVTRVRAAFNQQINAILPRQELCNPDFVFWQAQSAGFRQSIEALASATTISIVNKSKFNGIPIQLAPRREQDRIVSRIEELFSEIDEGERALERVGQLVERYRQSVLKAAVTGEVTREWRSSPASASEVTTTIDSASLPPGWSWRSMDELSWATSYGTSAKCLTEPDGIPVLRIPNVRGGRIDLSDLKWAPADLELDAADLLAPGDLLVVRTNGSDSLIGVGAVVLEPQPQPSYFASYLIRFRLKPEPFLAEWVNLLWQSDVVRRFVHEHKATSAGQYNISQSKLRALRLPVPPELERKQLLDAWRTVSTRIAAMLREISTGRAAATALRQSILKAAFSGQLVPQDPREEPASALLARLAAQAAEVPAPPRRSVRRQPKPARAGQ